MLHVRRYLVPVITVLVALLVSVSLLPRSAQAQGLRMTEVGGFGLVVRDTSTYEYGSLDSNVNGSAKKGEIVYLNGWQIGVYHVGTLRWIPDTAVQPIIDGNGRPMVNYVTVQNGTYFMNGQPLKLPARHTPQANRFLQNPTVNAPIIYNGTNVPTDWAGDLVNTSGVWLGSREPVVATMRVTDLYHFIYLRTAPSWDAPRASYHAYEGEILTAYEVVNNQWYRIGPNVWAPRFGDGETYLVPENVASYAPPEYYNGGKWISVDLKNQRLTAWEGNDVVISSPVKTGKYGYATPTGVWRTYEKIPNERMSGSDYDLMDVAWTQYFTRSRIALHAAYWHNAYNGRPGSHGCVNMPIDKAEAVFNWAPLGTTVVTHNPYIFDAQDIRDASKWSQYER